MPLELTVDDLAARAGMTVRTVRFYAGRGLLPPPELRGRVGVYGDVHLARLVMIRDLQQCGFTLAAIERYVADLPPDATADDVALHHSMITPWLPEEPEEVDRASLDRRAGRRLSDEEVDRLAALGVLERVGTDGGSDRVRLASATVLGFGIDILELPIPFETIVAAQKVTEKHAAAMAHELQQLFYEAVLRPYTEGTPDEAERERMRSVLARLPTLTTRGVVHAFRGAVNAAIRDALAR